MPDIFRPPEIKEQKAGRAANYWSVSFSLSCCSLSLGVRLVSRGSVSGSFAPRPTLPNGGRWFLRLHQPRRRIFTWRSAGRFLSSRSLSPLVKKTPFRCPTRRKLHVYIHFADTFGDNQRSVLAAIES